MTIDFSGRANVDAAIKHQHLPDYSSKDLVRLTEINNAFKRLSVEVPYPGVEVGQPACVTECFGFSNVRQLLEAAAAGSTKVDSTAAAAPAAAAGGLAGPPPPPPEVDEGFGLSEACFLDLANLGSSSTSTPPVGASGTKHLAFSKAAILVPALTCERKPFRGIPAAAASRVLDLSGTPPPLVPIGPLAAAAAAAAAGVQASIDLVAADPALAVSSAAPAAAAAGLASAAPAAAGLAPTGANAGGGVHSQFQREGGSTRAVEPAGVLEVGTPRSKYAARCKTYFDVTQPVKSPEECAFFHVLLELELHHQLDSVIALLRDGSSSSHADGGSSSSSSQVLTVSDIFARAEHAIRHHSYEQRVRELGRQPNYDRIKEAWNMLISYDHAPTNLNRRLPASISPKHTNQIRDYDRDSTKALATEQVFVRLQALGGVSGCSQLDAAASVQGVPLSAAEAAAATAGAVAAAAGGAAAAAGSAIPQARCAAQFGAAAPPLQGVSLLAAGAAAPIVQAVAAAAGGAAAGPAGAGTVVPQAAGAMIPNAFTALKAGAASRSELGAGSRGPLKGSKQRVEKEKRRCTLCNETGHSTKICGLRCQRCMDQKKREQQAAGQSGRNVAVVWHVRYEACPQGDTRQLDRDWPVTKPK